MDDDILVLISATLLIKTTRPGLEVFNLFA